VNPLSVFACENQPIVLEGLVRILGGANELRLSGHEPDLEATLRRVAREQPDILLLGQPPALKSILPLLARARQVAIKASIILWVAERSDMDSFRALQMGAKGVIERTQPVDAILECLRSVGQGNVWLEPSSRAAVPRSQSRCRVTRREAEIIQLVCRGLKNSEIADVIAISLGTVKVHLMHIFKKTGARDRFELALHGQQILASTSAEEPKLLPRGAGSGT
jgi:two-component system, NarL family, nitrate/nitrite response regulator NarL